MGGRGQRAGGEIGRQRERLEQRCMPSWLRGGGRAGWGGGWQQVQLRLLSSLARMCMHACHTLAAMLWRAAPPPRLPCNAWQPTSTGSPPGRRRRPWPCHPCMRCCTCSRWCRWRPRCKNQAAGAQVGVAHQFSYGGDELHFMAWHGMLAGPCAGQYRRRRGGMRRRRGSAGWWVQCPCVLTSCSRRALPGG